MDEQRYLMSADMRAAAGISRTTFDYYLRIQMIKPSARSETGYLLFSPTERDKLLKIIELRRQSFSIEEIRKMLETGIQP